MRYFVLHKPYGYLSQFTEDRKSHKTLADLGPFPKGVYPVGRLDKDSEGLLILTDDKKLNHHLLNPQKAHERTYWVQCEGNITEEAISQLSQGVHFSANKKNFKSLPAKARQLAEGEWFLDERYPLPRDKHGFSFIELKLIEGKNRQVRKMCAAVGFPCLRLVRVGIEKIELNGMKPADIREFKQEDIYDCLRIAINDLVSHKTKADTAKRRR